VGWIGNVVARTVLRKGMKKALKGANSLGGKKDKRSGDRRKTDGAKRGKKGARETA
jgi:hypothetical protein